MAIFIHKANLQIKEGRVRMFNTAVLNQQSISVNFPT